MIKESKQDVIGLSKWELDTPCLLLDRKLLQQNLLTMQAAANSVKKYLRPHAKSHKCSKLAKLQIQTGSFGICVAKLSEAEVLIKRGVRNVLITAPVTTLHKIERVLACTAADAELTVVVDNLENARMLNRVARRVEHELNVLVDLDPHMRRSGVAFGEALTFARSVYALPFLNFKGIQCYAGHLQHVRDFSDREDNYLKIMKQAVEVFHAFNEVGLPCDIFSAGGTGTYPFDAKISEISEIQSGSYTLMDAEYFAIQDRDGEDFKRFKPALTLLTTVISANHAEHVTVDAGLKSLYYSEALPLVTYPDMPGLQYEWGFGDEFGKIITPLDASLGVNSVVELIVPHCDPTVNMFDRYYVTRDDVVIDVWDIDLRGCSI